jgi:hypothetical protein
MPRRGRRTSSSTARITSAAVITSWNASAVFTRTGVETAIAAPAIRPAAHENSSTANSAVQTTSSANDR